MNSMDRENLWVWEEIECEALRKALKDFNDAAQRADRITRRKLANAMGVSPTTVNSFLNGSRPLTKSIAIAFQNISGVPVRSFSARLADEIDAAQRRLSKRDKEV
ncbi:helix-turn-helix domain-containing protein [Pseudomonas sp. JUb96]|uniref:helix-turn-helix domain-containing protein n=1 Tax=Pseudomonas sp. JUb96 TaxID=2940539 RepID=UPI002226C546|nr:helix-turn-helix domain-containing protein [Pseudomonas sp. JUb96]MCW2272409.1 plasmid maintenance system antidote protein VapI [Pseudomonas sp. JUb96]